MFCPECDTIMEEVGTIREPAENEVTDLFECPKCHCIDKRHRTVFVKKFRLPAA
jgi:hypothetical protein